MIVLLKVSRSYEREDGARVNALDEVSLEIGAGEFVALRGPSGSGKSSLLNIIGCLDKPTSGTCLLEERDVSRYSDRQMSAVRAHTVGFVFQSFNLLPRTTAVENVELAMLYATGQVDRSKALRALARVGVEHRATHYSSELSGGEQQRVAIARALVNDPPVVLADEPTGNLDAAGAEQVMSLLCELHGEGRTIVLVTHDEAIAAHAHRELALESGRVVCDRVRKP